MGMRNFWTVCLPWIAEAAATMGHAQEGLEAFAHNISVLGQTDQRYAEAELYWIKGMLLEQLPSADVQAAEVCYLKAIEVARHQQTKLLELRAATRLGRLWQSQGKRKEALDLLKPVYNWFTEGFDTKDLKEAKALLEELRAE
jgi:predicted ATPase